MSERFIEVLTEAFGTAPFTVHDIFATVPDESLPARVRAAMLAEDTFGPGTASAGRSLGKALRDTPGLETIRRSKRGRVWRVLS